MITLAADIGGTRIKLGIVYDQHVLAHRCLEARSGVGLGPQLPRIAAALAFLCTSEGIRFGDCEVLGVAFPGIALREVDEIDYETVFRLARQQDACATALREEIESSWARQ